MSPEEVGNLGTGDLLEKVRMFLSSVLKRIFPTLYNYDSPTQFLGIPQMSKR